MLNCNNFWKRGIHFRKCKYDVYPDWSNVRSVLDIVHIFALLSSYKSMRDSYLNCGEVNI